MRRIATFAAAIMIAASTLALAHDGTDHDHSGSDQHAGHSHQHAGPGEGGSPGKASDVTRDVTIIATDVAFAPSTVAVKAGETVRFIVRNEGKLVHELTIGTKSMQAAHQSEMLGLAVSGVLEADRVDRAKLGNHNHGNNVLLEPGQSGEIIWTFAKAQDLEFGCNVPGHYEQGMKGSFEVQ